MNYQKILCFLLLFIFLCSPAVAEEVAKVIKVSGTGVISSKPDRARIHMQVSNVNKSIVAGKKFVDENVSQVQKMLLDQGVKPEHIKTSGLSVYEERSELMNRDGSRNVTKQEGYRVSRAIVSQIEDLTRLDVILDNALNLGTNSIQNIEFYSSRSTELNFEAMEKASEDARKKADFLVKQFGCKLGKAQQIEYDYRDKDRPLYGAVMGGKGGPPSFLQGTIEVAATVNVV